jgi:hypothetical protein
MSGNIEAEGVAAPHEAFDVSYSSQGSKDSSGTNSDRADNPSPGFRKPDLASDPEEPQISQCVLRDSALHHKACGPGLAAERNHPEWRYAPNRLLSRRLLTEYSGPASVSDVGAPRKFVGTRPGNLLHGLTRDRRRPCLP